MLSTANRLLFRTGNKDAEVLAKRESKSWVLYSGKKEREKCEPGPSGLYWARHDGNTGVAATILGEAMQIVDITERTIMLSDPRKHALHGLKTGKALLHCAAHGDRPDRWFGPATVASVGNDVDPSLLGGMIDEIGPVPDAERIIIGVGRAPRQYLAPGAVLPPKIGDLDARDRFEVYEDLYEFLQPEAERRFTELTNRVPGILSRVQVSGDSDLQDHSRFIRTLLSLPVFKRIWDEENRVRQEAFARQEKKVRADLERLELEKEGFVAQRRTATLVAIRELHEDPEALALLTALGITRVEASPPINPFPIEELRELITPLYASTRDQERLERLEGKIDEISSRPSVVTKIDLEPIVEALSSWKRPRVLSSATTTADLRIAPKIDDAEDLNDALVDERLCALAAVARAQRLPLIFGPGAAETASAFAHLVAAGRWRLVPIPTMCEDLRMLLRLPEVVSLLDASREHADHLHVIVLDGINRAPTETYLEPLLALRDLGAPLPGSELPWPENLLLLGTHSFGPTTLEIAPGVWDRAVAVPAAPRRVSKTQIREVAMNFWNAAPPALVDALDPTPYLPSELNGHAFPIRETLRRLAKALGDLELRDGEYALQGAVCAACLAHPGRPRLRALSTDRESVFAPLFTAQS